MTDGQSEAAEQISTSHPDITPTSDISGLAAVQCADFAAEWMRRCFKKCDSEAAVDNMAELLRDVVDIERRRRLA